MRFISIITVLLIVVGLGWWLLNPKNKSSDKEPILTYIVQPKTQQIRLYWKDDAGSILGTLGNLKTYIESRNEKLLFAANAGMFAPDYSPVGLFISAQKTIKPLELAAGEGNFYIKPNGVFYVTTNNKAFICKSTDFVANQNISYATQSGPMLVIDGQIHRAFKKTSTHLNTRNGVGILPDGRVVFAMSKNEINLYDFAFHFKKMGCQQALYFDGHVSRTYLPSKKWRDLGGYFGVMVAVVEK
jgi:uncharacterized protein YigE (DUF2233 family)